MNDYFKNDMYIPEIEVKSPVITGFGLLDYIERAIAKYEFKPFARVLYKKKETIIKQHSNTSNLYFLKDGLAKVYTERRNEKNLIIKLEHGNTLLATNQLFEEIYNHSVVALSNCEVCIIPRHHFLKILSEDIDLCAFVIKDCSRQTSFLFDKISCLGTKQMHGRLADTIMLLCDSELLQFEVFNFLSRKDIAEMSGMSSESAIRLLTEFKNDGLIRTSGKKIEINNIELLTRLSEIG